MQEATFPDACWWEQLTPAWKQAFAETVFNHAGQPSKEELAQLFNAAALRLAGPSAPYPNMSFELTDLTGIAPLTNLQVLVVIHHDIETIREVSRLPLLKALFVHNNRLSSLEGIEQLVHLEQLYAQCNSISSITPVEKLTSLKEFYIHHNAVASLEGLSDEHADKLEAFFCKPNNSLKQKEILRTERETGIRCRGI